ncbi:MAG: GtrA family protein [Ktedonobacteraceae bacterium]
MKNTVVSNDLDELSVATTLGKHSSRFATLPETLIDSSKPLIAQAQSARSYQPYAWSLPNTILDIVDNKTNGRGGQLQRVVSYLFFGGLAAVVNLGVFAIMLRLMPGDNIVQNTAAYMIAAELSIMANFIPNDRFTFNTLPGAQRPWLQRCIRFHATCIVGTILTYLIEVTLKFRAHTPALIAEAIAIVIVLIYNFSAHHLFTYAHPKK